MKLTGFRPFTSAVDALTQCNAVSEGVLTSELKAFLQQALPSSKKGKFVLGVSDAKLGAAILEATEVRCECNDRVLEALRGVRTHYERMVSGLKEGDAGRAALGLAHAYSRGKVKFNVNRSDNMIIQSIATLDTLDKDINTLVMRVREWYAWHFPELSKVVSDNYQYARAALVVQDKSALTEDDLPKLAEALGGDEDKAREVLDAARASMGQDISPVDLQHIEALAQRVVELVEFRQGLGGYMSEKMGVVAPNLGALIGDTVAARLIAHAGSLTNLAKYPASTVQILGAEKALFRALKTKGNTPKYGLIYHSTFIGRAQVRLGPRPARPPARSRAPGIVDDHTNNYERFMSGLRPPDSTHAKAEVPGLVTRHAHPRPTASLTHPPPCRRATRAASRATWLTSAPLRRASTASPMKARPCLATSCASRWSSGWRFTTRACRLQRTSS